MRVTIHHPTRDCSVNYDVERDVISFTLWGEAHEGGRGYTELNLPHLSLKRPYEEVHLPVAVAQAASISTKPSVSSAGLAERIPARSRSTVRRLVGGSAALGLCLLTILFLYRPGDRDSQTDAHPDAAFRLHSLERPTASRDLSSHSFASSSAQPSPFPGPDIDSSTDAEPHPGPYKRRGDVERSDHATLPSPAPGFGMP